LYTLQNSKDILGDAAGIETLQDANKVNDEIKIK